MLHVVQSKGKRAHEDSDESGDVASLAAAAAAAHAEKKLKKVRVANHVLLTTCVV